LMEYAAMNPMSEIARRTDRRTPTTNLKLIW
jgi:hypothetical protein